MEANITPLTLCTLPTEEKSEARFCFVFHNYVSLLTGTLDDRIRTAIHMTADETSLSPVYIAKVLVEHGLKASKNAFPDSFVDFIEDKSGLDPWAAGAMTYAQNKLAKLWQIESHQPYYAGSHQVFSEGAYLQ